MVEKLGTISKSNILKLIGVEFCLFIELVLANLLIYMNNVFERMQKSKLSNACIVFSLEVWSVFFFTLRQINIVK